MYREYTSLLLNKIKKTDIIVFSHLRWNFVYQRPQHLISRLSKNRKVLFVEEGIEDNVKSIPTANTYKVSNNITVLQPMISSTNYFEDLAMLIQEEKTYLKSNNPILWFYSPAFSPVIQYLKHDFVVYDCMDELSAFAGASPSIIQLEKHLLSEASIVFTGGKSLYQAKVKLHDNVYCFPSSVDRKFFKKITGSSINIPSDLKNIKSPIVGFYGVLDERLDTQLLDQIALLMPEISFVMIGPIAKISEEDLPKRANIYYLGSKDYTNLPNYVKYFDITMMPFALNNSTKFISPTKTLEYMAANKPIISTAIHDVVRDYSKMIKIISNAKQFKKAILYYLNEKPSQIKQREALQEKVLSQTSWDKTTKSIDTIIKDYIPVDSLYLPSIPLITTSSLLNENLIWKKQQ